MFKLIIWIFWLILLVILCFVQSRRVLATPQLGYMVGFLLQAVFALYFVNIWELDLSAETMFVLMGGATLFFIVSVLSIRIFCRARIKSRYGRMVIALRRAKIEEQEFIPIHIAKWKLWALLAFQVLSIVLVIVYFMANLSGVGILGRIAAYDWIIKYGDSEEVLIPDAINTGRIVSSMSCYILSYVFLHSVIHKYKQYRVLLAICIILGLVNTGVIGGRLLLVTWLVGAVIQAYIIWGNRVGWQKKLPIKILVRMCLVGMFIVVVFQWSLRLFGRESTRDPLEYMGIYLSAQLKNLDIFVRERNFGVTRLSTLGRTVVFFTRRLGLYDGFELGDEINRLLPFRSIKGHSLGNAASTYPYYLLDGGHPALIFFTSLMAVVCQYIYYRAIYKRGKSNINVDIVLYSYAFPPVFLSFFGDFFYKEAFGLKLIEFLITTIALRWFFLNCGAKSMKKGTRHHSAEYGMEGEGP